MDNMKTERSAGTMASSETILRDLRIYPASNGQNASMFPAHCFTYRVEDSEGNLVFTNADQPADIEMGSHDIGFHKCVLDWVRYRWRPEILDRLVRTGAEGADLTAELYAPRTLTIVDTGVDGVFKAYRMLPEEVAQGGLKRSGGGSFVANAAWVAAVFAEAEDHNTTIKLRKPEGVHEVATLEQVRNEGKRRWLRAKKDKEKQFAA
ncbi:hypothetical protein [Rhizobium leguminosarum]